jgi:hypothetical protein
MKIMGVSKKTKSIKRKPACRQAGIAKILRKDRKGL